MARIFIEVEVKGIHQNFEFETDDEINCGDFKQRLIQSIISQNANYYLSNDKTSIYSQRHQGQLNEKISLKENRIISGDLLLII